MPTPTEFSACASCFRFDFVGKLLKFYLVFPKLLFKFSQFTAHVLFWPTHFNPRSFIIESMLAKLAVQALVLVNYGQHSFFL